MTQKELIFSYIQERGSILPAKMYGGIYKGQMFGSELSKRCRELRADGKLSSKPDGKFERYFLPLQIKLPPAFAPKEKQQVNFL